MKQLVKVENGIFKNVYEGINGSRKVVCILDANCVRYIVSENGKKKTTREFNNAQTDVCYKNAEKALNRN